MTVGVGDNHSSVLVAGLADASNKMDAFKAKIAKRRSQMNAKDAASDADWAESSSRQAVP